MFTDRLFPTNRANECPICGDHSGDCRTKDNEEQAVLCGHSPNARKFDREGLYICVNDKAKGHTPHVWVLAKDDTWDDAAQARYHLEKCLRLDRTIKAKQEALEKELGLPDRDKYHRAIQSQLSLSSAHRKHLLDRGLYDDQIETIGFVSVTKFQKLKGTFPDNLPGYNTYSKNLTNFKDGILIPIFQEDKIAAFKIRLDEANDGQRYTSLSSQKYTSFHLYGESPLAVLHGDKNKGLWLCEGELKPLVANQKFNIAILGGAKYWQNSPNHCSKFLARFKEIYGNRLNIGLDGGDILNQQVMNQIISEYKFFESQGFDVCFVWWNQVTKEENDIDELDNLDNVEFIKLERLEEIIKENKSKAIDQERWEKWKKSRKYTPTPGYVQHEKDFKFPANLPKSKLICGIKSGTGTNKTGAMIENMIDASNLLVGCLNNLLHQTESRAIENGVKLLHFNSIEDKVNPDDSLSFCIHSAWKKGIDFKDKNVYFDEILSTFLTVINGGNLNYYEQERAMKAIKDIVNEANNVYLLDANLSDDIVDFIASLDDSGKKVIKILNTKKIPPHTIKFVDGIETTELDNGEVEIKLKPKSKSHLYKRMLTPGCVPIVHSDSKKLCHEIDERLRKEGKSGLVITSKTVGEMFAKEFLADPNEYLRRHKPDYLVVSPSCGSGVSITEKYFTDKFSFFGGVLTTDNQHQIMFRSRDFEIPHYVYCPEYSSIGDATIPNHYTGKKIKEVLLERMNQTFFMSLNITNDRENAFKRISELLANKENDPWFDISTEYWALTNFELANLRKCLIYSLREAGHDVEEIQEEIDSKIDEEFKEIREELIAKEALALVHSPVFSEEELAKVEKLDHTEEVQRKIRKSKMFIKTLPGIDKHEAYQKFAQLFWENDERDKFRYINEHQRFSRFINFEDNKKLHESYMFKRATSHFCFIGDIRGYDYTRIEALHKLGFMKFFELGRKWNKESKDLIALCEAILKDKKLRIELGLENFKEQKNNKERIELLKKLLAYFGVELAEPKKELGENGKRLNCYQINQDEFNHPLRLMIIELTQARDKAQIIKDQEKLNWKFEDFDEMVDKLSDHILNIQTHADVEVINSYLDIANTPTQSMEDDKKQEVWKYKGIYESAKAKAVDKLIEKYKAVRTYNQYEWLIYNLTVTSKRTVGAEDRNQISDTLDEILKLAGEKLEPSELQRIKDLRPLEANYMKLIDDSIIAARAYPVGYFDKLPVTSKWKFRLETAVSFGKQFVKKIIEDFFTTVPISEDANYRALYDLYESYSS
jgi:hypothetical protein